MKLRASLKSSVLKLTKSKAGTLTEALAGQGSLLNLCPDSLGASVRSSSMKVGFFLVPPTPLTLSLDPSRVSSFGFPLDLDQRALEFPSINQSRIL